MPREDAFDISVASEMMAVVCLASDMEDLKERLSRMIVGYTYDDEPVTAGQLNATGALSLLLKDALKPNLVQTLENTPAIIQEVFCKYVPAIVSSQQNGMSGSYVARAIRCRSGGRKVF